MIVVRNSFTLQFGQAREATDLWKQAAALIRRSGFGGDVRLMTDVAGPSFYTMVLETTHESLGAWEKASEALRKDEQWRQVYGKIVALTESGHREILKIIE